MRARELIDYAQGIKHARLRAYAEKYLRTRIIDGDYETPIVPVMCGTLNAQKVRETLESMAEAMRVPLAYDERDQT